MKPQWKKFAPVGLYLALIGALAGTGFLIVQREFNLPVQISLGVIILGLALFVFLDPQRTRAVLTGRQARYGSNSLIMSLAFIGILIVVNFIGFKYSPQWDLTADKAHTLAPETIDLLGSLKSPVVAEAFYSSRYPYSTDDARTLLQNFENDSNGQFTYEFIDPDANPVKAQEANIARDGTIVLVSGDRQESVTYASEEEMSNALLRLANPGERTVYFLSGHGERSLDASDESSYSGVKGMLEAKNYTVKSLNLMSNPVPDDALSIIIAGAKQPLTDAEVASINTYLAGGGSVVWLVEPDALNDNPEASDPLKEYIAGNWGINLTNDIVIDPNINPPLIAIANSYGSHAITDKLQNMTSLFPTARSLQHGAVPSGVTLTDLVKSSSVAWGETDLESIKANQYQLGQNDIAGPVTLAIAASNATTNSRVAVVGDADFASDGYYQNYANGDLMVNIVDWAAGQENLLNLTPKQTTQRMLIPPKQTTIWLLFLGLVILIPGAVVTGGVVTWVQRRNRG